MDQIISQLENDFVIAYRSIVELVISDFEQKSKDIYFNSEGKVLGQETQVVKVN